MGPLFSFEKAGLAKMHQQRHERPFGQWAGMYAACGGDDHVRLVQAGFPDHLGNTATAALHPFGVFREDDVARAIRRRERVVKQDFGTFGNRRHGRMVYGDGQDVAPSLQAESASNRGQPKTGVAVRSVAS